MSFERNDNLHENSNPEHLNKPIDKEIIKKNYEILSQFKEDMENFFPDFEINDDIWYNNDGSIEIVGYVDYEMKSGSRAKYIDLHVNNTTGEITYKADDPTHDTIAKAGDFSTMVLMVNGDIEYVKPEPDAVEKAIDSLLGQGTESDKERLNNALHIDNKAELNKMFETFQNEIKYRFASLKLINIRMYDFDGVPVFIARNENEGHQIAYNTDTKEYELSMYNEEYVEDFDDIREITEIVAAIRQDKSLGSNDEEEIDESHEILSNQFRLIEMMINSTPYEELAPDKKAFVDFKNSIRATFPDFTDFSFDINTEENTIANFSAENPENFNAIYYDPGFEMYTMMGDEISIDAKTLGELADKYNLKG